MRELINSLYNSDDETTGHSVAAGLVLAASEAIEGLIRNGVDPYVLRVSLFRLLMQHASCAPFLRELMSNWLADGDENGFRLEELHSYNEALRNGILGETR